MRRHRIRYFMAPTCLILALTITAAVLSARQLQWVLVGYFGWQFFHFQKQNLGVAALGARAQRLPALTKLERCSLTGTGIGGILALVGHPRLLQLVGIDAQDWLFAAGATIFGLAVATGVLALARRELRPMGFTVIYLSGLLFFLPVLIFSSPFAAVAGLTIAHGLQYLVLVGLVAAAPDQPQSVAASLTVLLSVSLVIGIALNRASHLHTSYAAGRAVYGTYLGLVCAHFVIDAGLWRLRDQFPREFLTQRLPYLLTQPPAECGTTATVRPPHDVKEGHPPSSSPQIR